MAARWPWCLLLDMEMPFKDGVATARWVREYEAAHGKPRCRVIMLSGNSDPASVAKALEAGADRFLAKPVSPDTLLSTLLELDGTLPGAQGVPAFPETAPSAGADTPAGARSDEVVVVDPDWLATFPGFVRTQSGNVEAMALALRSGDRERVRFLAHRALGSLSLMGLHWAARQCRTLEQSAEHGSSEELAQRIEALREHLSRVRAQSTGS
jgi:CheY-like chemotaxis protein